jgi:hypothetical protein
MRTSRRSLLLATLALAAVHGAPVPVPAAVVHHQRELITEEITAKAKAVAEAAAARAHAVVTDGVSRISQEHKDQIGAAWTKVVGVSNSVTEQAAAALQSSMKSSLEIVKNVLHISDEMIKQGLEVLANLTFCAIFLFGFAYFPADFMLLVGIITFFIGPALVLGALELIGYLGYLAACVSRF